MTDAAIVSWRRGWAGVGLVAMLALAAAAQAPPSRSEALARQLSSLLVQQKLDTFAARLPDPADTFAAAMLFPGVQLLVVSGQPTAVPAIQDAIDHQRYADAYGILQQAVRPATKLFVQDLKADGLHPRAPDAVDIVYEQVSNQWTFDGAPAKHHMNEAQYAERFSVEDEKYARVLSALVEAVKVRPQPTP